MAEHDNTKSTGTLVWTLLDGNGDVKASGECKNLITQIGDQLYGERGAGITTVPVPTGMKLGVGTTAVAKTGAGAALITYLTNSNQAFDGGFPTSALNGSARRITYQATFAPGKATSATAISEAVIVNETIATNATSLAAATISRIILSPSVPAKTAADTLILVWTHDNLGA